jgi:putative FmdB family regulatory protein
LAGHGSDRQVRCQRDGPRLSLEFCGTITTTTTDQQGPFAKRLTREARGGVLVRRRWTMAIYEFECTACGERFEVSRAMSQHDELKHQPPPCPRCGHSGTHEVAPLVGYKTPSSG